MTPKSPGSRAPDQRTRKRASVACEQCHARKDGCDCTVASRKKPRRRARGSGVEPGGSEPSAGLATRPSDDAQPAPSEATSGESSERHVRVDSSLGLPAGGTSDFVRSQPATHGRDVVEFQDDTLNSSDIDEGDNPGGYSDAMNGSPDKDSTAPFYAGETNVLTFVMDVCQTERPSHYLVPRIAVQTVCQEDLTLLRTKGAFTLPDQSVCDELIRHYFRYVHPFLPILDANRFLVRYQEHGLQQLNLMLLWSVFFAASNFVSPELARKAGFRSRKAMKRDMYQKAKVRTLYHALYDVDYEKDKIVLIQSVILLAYWYVDTEDRTGSWYWIGVAIGLCHSVGLHRNPARLPPSASKSKYPYHSLWRLIWWSCYLRETWISFGLGRPMRINSKDTDLPMPTPEDILLVSGVDRDHRFREYIPASMHVLGQCWIEYLHLSIVLSRILKSHYRPGMLSATTSEIETSQQSLLEYFEMRTDTTGLDKDTDVQLFSLQLDLFERNVLIALYRPYILSSPSDLSPSEHKAWRSTIMPRVLEAASSVNLTLIKLSQLGYLSVCQSALIQAISPTMQMHLYEASQANPLSRQVGLQQLDTCMTVLQELRRTYWAADFSIRLFSEARSRMRNRTKRLGNEENSTKVPNGSLGSANGLLDARSSSGPYQEYQISPSSDQPSIDFGFPDPDQDIFSNLELDFFKFTTCEPTHQFDMDWDPEANSLLPSQDFLDFVGKNNKAYTPTETDMSFENAEEDGLAR
ncbi:hypothetical protein AYO20_01285 [Fonsecaea nubica]|uniref:Xylanolytic transcriptional activator regulatory domain-containing protein n=1 Tax=Fonsecaea nubica TaxID=856822 RepID=A0A178DEA7_9EURO|nr:hypothetical protein AYO20_01285 [Fonsecaea nubica]OAL39415.1 hypothetical protein AYO20_01285 [Fonsecaea nubica]